VREKAREVVYIYMHHHTMCISNEMIRCAEWKEGHDGSLEAGRGHWNSLKKVESPMV